MNAADGDFLLSPELETVPLDTEVLGILAAEFGWLSSYAVTKRLPPDLQDEKKVEASLKRLVKAGKVLITERYGNTDLFRFPPRPGEEPTAEVPPEPAPRVIRYAGPESDEIPAARRRGERLTLKPAAPRAPAEPSPQETTMRITKDQVLQQLADGPKTREQIAKALKCSEEAPGYHLTQLQNEGKVHKPEGRRGPWALLKGQAATAPAAMPTRSKPGKAAIGDLDLKLLVLNSHIDAAQDAGRTISAYVLTQVREDLERLAA